MKTSFPRGISRISGAPRDGRMLVGLLAAQIWLGGACSTVEAADSSPERRATSHARSGAPINAIAFSPDGRELAGGAQDKSVCIWDVHSLKPRQVLPTEAEVHSVAFSSDGKMFASGGMDRVARLWNIRGGHFALGHALDCRGPVETLAFSPDSKTVVCGTLGSGNIHLYDTATGKLKRTFWEASNGINAVAFSPDGKTLASGGANLKLWDARVENNAEQKLELSVAELQTSQKKWLRTELGDYAATWVVWSPKTDLVVSADGTGGVTAARKKVFVWDTKAGRLQKEMRAEGPGELTSLAFSPDGKLVAAGIDTGDLWVWKVVSGERAWSLKAHAKAIRSIAFSPSEPVLAS